MSQYQFVSSDLVFEESLYSVSDLFLYKCHSFSLRHVSDIFQFEHFRPDASELLFRKMDISQIWRSTALEALLFFVKIWEHKLPYELTEIDIVVCLIFQYKLQSIQHLRSSCWPLMINEFELPEVSIILLLFIINTLFEIGQKILSLVPDELFTIKNSLEIEIIMKSY